MKDKSLYSDKDGIVTIFYNQSSLFKAPFMIFEGCSYVKKHKKEAVQYADSKISSGEWYNYIIPEITFSNIIFEKQMFEVFICNDPLEATVFENMSYSTIKSRTGLDLKKDQMSYWDLKEFLRTAELFNISNKHFKIFIL